MVGHGCQQYGHAVLMSKQIHTGMAFMHRAQDARQQGQFVEAAAIGSQAQVLVAAALDVVPNIIGNKLARTRFIIRNMLYVGRNVVQCGL